MSCTNCNGVTNLPSFGELEPNNGRRRRRQDNPFAIMLRNHTSPEPHVPHEEMVSNYDIWAQYYDEELKGHYNGPEILTKAVASYYPCFDRRNQIKILDVAAGTGRIGVLLYELGFMHMDALEPSTKMMALCRKRNLYEKYFETSVGFGRINEISTYDCLVISGGMDEGHIPCSALSELVRVVKPNGLIFILMRVEFLVNVDEYKDRLVPMMDLLELKGSWKLVSRTSMPNYSFKRDGVLFVFEVLPSKKVNMEQEPENHNNCQNF